MKINNYTTTILLVVLALCLFLVLPSCDNQENWLLIDEETKSYCYFEHGASYIFKDSVTGSTDSIKISNDWYIPETSRHGYEYYETNITNWNDQKIGSYHISVEGDSGNPISFAYWTTSETNLNYEYNTYTSWDGIVDEIHNDGDHGELVGSYPNLQVEYNTFYNVKKFKKEYYITAEDRLGYTYSYWAENIGLIKYENYNENDSILSNINLIEYEINN